MNHACTFVNVFLMWSINVWFNILKYIYTRTLIWPLIPISKKGFHQFRFKFRQFVKNCIFSLSNFPPSFMGVGEVNPTINDLHESGIMVHFLFFVLVNFRFHNHCMQILWGSSISITADKEQQHNKGVLRRGQKNE